MPQIPLNKLGTLEVLKARQKAKSLTQTTVTLSTEKSKFLTETTLKRVKSVDVGLYFCQGKAPEGKLFLVRRLKVFALLEKLQEKPSVHESLKSVGLGGVSC